ncbi:MAG TPA: L,D-transpeptidase family protein [Anaerolineae bacterium]|nr:L,D-transpeptidase family protein [Anaerolineae bacterium]
MSRDIEPPTENLSLGIAAARAGRFENARRYLTAVLAQTPHNTTAMCWMAFVAPAPEQSVAWLKQALALEPDNQHLKAGLKWAEQRLTQTPAPTPLPEPTVRPVVRPRDKLAIQPAAPKKVSSKLTSRRKGKGWLRWMVAAFIAGGATGAILNSRLVDVASFQPLQTKLLAQVEAFSPNRLIQIEPSSSSLTLSGVTVKYLDLPETGRSSATAVASQLGEQPGQAVNFVAEIDQPAALVSNSVSELPRENRPAPGEARLSAVPAQRFEAVTPDPGLTGPRRPASTAGPTDEPVTDSALAARSSSPNPPQAEAVVPADSVLDGVRLFVPVAESQLVHQPASADEKWIEVDIATQRVTAWEGNVPVMSFPVSTGLPETPTVEGKFNIYWKLESTLMTGPDYYLPEVPYTMYFYGGYGLHGAYWHSNFGQQMSHGCVNLSLADSKALFEWADPVIPPGETQVVASSQNPGTLVIVHTSS